MIFCRSAVHRATNGCLNKCREVRIYGDRREGAGNVNPKDPVSSGQAGVARREQHRRAQSPSALREPQKARVR